MTEQTIEEHSAMAAKKIAMCYLTASIANGYLEGAVDELRATSLLRHELKRRINNAVHYFDLFFGTVKWVFTAAGNADTSRLIINDYEVLQEACDRFMGADVRIAARQAWASDDLRQPDLYLCRVEGAEGCTHMVLRWTEQRQWLMYIASRYGGGWQGLLPGVRVQSVVERVRHADEEESK